MGSVQGLGRGQVRYAGIDCSSWAIDVAVVEGEEAEWHCFQLTGPKAFDRVRTVPDVLPSRDSAFWDSLDVVGIEEPTGRFKAGSGFRVQGAVLSMIPAKLKVIPLTPSSWRKQSGIVGNASKEDVFRYVTYLLGRPPVSQDAADAYCMALATRKLEEE